MAERIEIKSITTPVGTAISAPLKTALNFRQGAPVQVEISVPPGPSGLMGIALAHSGTKIIPHDESEWLITDDEKVIWPLTEYPTNSNWEVWTYNTDIYAHKIQVRMLFNELGSNVLNPNVAPALEQAMPSAGIQSEGTST